MYWSARDCGKNFTDNLFHIAKTRRVHSLIKVIIFLFIFLFSRSAFQIYLFIYLIAFLDYFQNVLIAACAFARQRLIKISEGRGEAQSVTDVD